MDWNDFTSGGIGALIGSAATILGFRGRMVSLEKECDDLRTETRTMFKEIRSDIKELIEKTAQRRKDG